MKTRRSWPALAVAFAALILAVSTTPAYASDELLAETDAECKAVPLNAIGYDAEVATRNGYEIVTYPDGTWESIPVGPAAVAFEEARLSAPRYEAAPDNYGQVGGKCGVSWIEVVPWSSQVNRVTSGYAVTHPVANRIGWSVQVASVGGWPLLWWNDGASPTTWQGTGYFSVAGWGGTAWVQSSSSVLLINGTICGSNSPSVSF